MKALVTGASGFVGRHLLASLSEAGIETVAAVRSHDSTILCPQVILGDLADLCEDSDLNLGNVDVVFHLAGLAHGRAGSGDRLEEALAQVNVNAARVLARNAARQGVSRFVFVSSIGVNGQWTDGVPFTESDVPAPSTAYGQSKWDAERALADELAGTATSLVVIRPPLVVGPGAPGSLALLIRGIRFRVPLPFHNVVNRRSLVSLENLSDFLILCALHNDAAGETFLIADDVLSTNEICRAIGRGLGIRTVFFPAPVELLLWASQVIGRQHIFRQLFCDLEVSSDKARTLLGWKPSQSSRAALIEAVSAR